MTRRRPAAAALVSAVLVSSVLVSGSGCESMRPAFEPDYDLLVEGSIDSPLIVVAAARAAEVLIVRLDLRLEGSARDVVWVFAGRDPDDLERMLKGSLRDRVRGDYFVRLGKDGQRVLSLFLPVPVDAGQVEFFIQCTLSTEYLETVTTSTQVIAHVTSDPQG